jgi:NAD(P)-dependent dehydrogenase (short-subunit alcohol dehydrogenase family)
MISGSSGTGLATAPLLVERGGSVVIIAGDAGRLDAMKRELERGAGSTVNIGATWARQVIKATPSTAYSMTEAGLRSLTQTLVVELADHGIGVNAGSPAVGVTPLFGALIQPEQIEETITNGFSAMHPVGRVGRPEDITRHIVFPPSGQAGWTTGAIRDVDGAMTAGRT